MIPGTSKKICYGFWYYFEVLDLPIELLSQQSNGTFKLLLGANDLSISHAADHHRSSKCNGEDECSTIKCYPEYRPSL